jgi:hypothetical protein
MRPDLVDLRTLTEHWRIRQRLSIAFIVPLANRKHLALPSCELSTDHPLG